MIFNEGFMKCAKCAWNQPPSRPALDRRPGMAMRRSAHYEGDTLVIDTVGIKARSENWP